ncbi:hypothetical protein SK128_021871, partial [Halocaridina rubra]
SESTFQQQFGTPKVTCQTRSLSLSSSSGEEITRGTTPEITTTTTLKELLHLGKNTKTNTRMRFCI